MKAILIYLDPDKKVVYKVEPTDKFGNEWKKVIDSVNNGVNYGVKYL